MRLCIKRKEQGKETGRKEDEKEGKRERGGK